MVVVQHEGPKAGRREFGPGRSTQFRLVLGTCLIRQRHVRTSLHSKSSDLRKLTGWWLNTKTPRHEEHQSDHNTSCSIVSFVPWCLCGESTWVAQSTQTWRCQTNRQCRSRQELPQSGTKCKLLPSHSRICTSGNTLSGSVAANEKICWHPAFTQGTAFEPARVGWLHPMRWRANRAGESASCCRSLVEC